MDTALQDTTRRQRPFDERTIDDATAATLRRVALWWGPGAVVVLVVGAWRVGVPASGEAYFWETSAQVALLAVYGVASLLARRWPMPSATAMTVAAFGIGVLSDLEYRPAWGVTLAILLWLPAGMLWLVWQRRKPLIDIVVLASALLLCLGGAAWAGSTVYGHFQGPQTEQSQRASYPDTSVRWVWAGAVTPTSFDVVARLDSDVTEARLVYGRSADLTGDVVRTDVVRADTDTNGVRFPLSGLQPGATYYYAVETEGRIDLSRTGRVRTLAEGAHSFTLAFASCARNGSNAQVFESIRDADPDLWLLTGDLHYSDIAEDRVVDYVRAYDQQLMEGAQQALYLAVPAVYMWDDHDYGPNDADRTTRSRPAALASYRALVPHYAFPLEGEQAPVAQAFTVGRVRFIVTDLRSARDPKSNADGPSKTMMGVEQLAWFESELVAAANSHALVIWVSSVPWIVRADEDGGVGDSWGAYATEREHIADVIADNGIDNLLMLAGDAHMVAADDGSNSDFSTSGGAGFPVLQAAALDRQGSFKGGPYSQGSHPGPGQYGHLEVTDTGGEEVSVRFEGRRWDGEVLVSYQGSFGTG